MTAATVCPHVMMATAVAVGEAVDMGGQAGSSFLDCLPFLGF